MMDVVLTLLVCITLFTASHCFQWGGDLRGGDTVYTCVNDPAVLSWNMTLDPGETVSDMKWLFYGTGSQQLIAVYTASTFLPTPTFSSRVDQVDIIGLMLKHAQSTDSGDYAVEVNVQSGSSHVTYVSRVHLQVLDEAKATLGATVVAAQSPNANYDNNTNQYHVKLTCASPSVDLPPTSVIWTTPLGATVPDSNATDGVFSLLIPNPVKGGNYTCRVAPSIPAATCLAPNSPALRGDTVNVDEMAARVALLEVQQRVLMAENTYLKDQNARLTQRVNFDARLSGSVTMTDRQTLVLDVAVTNEGHSYNPNTGVFTAPRDGTYFFVATVSSSGFGRNADMFAKVEMMKDNDVISSIYTKSVDYHAMGSCTALIHLTQGQRVYLRSNGDGNFDNYLTSFTGFMIYPDAASRR